MVVFRYKNNVLYHKNKKIKKKRGRNKIKVQKLCFFYSLVTIGFIK